MQIAIAIAVLLVLAAVMIVATARRRATTGRLSRETRTRDQDAAAPNTPDAAANEVAVSAEARTRADETRTALDTGGAPPATRTDATPATRVDVEVDEETLGIARRQFFNRALLMVIGLVALPTFGASLIAFLWPTASGGFGGKVKVGASRADIEATFVDKKAPFYVPDARSYIQPYPSGDIAKAEAVYQAPILANMNEGLTAIYQKCVHLGCKVPWCPSSQWFECPCHGSKYNRVGEKRGGPAPRGLDHFPMEISGDSITIDTTVPFIGAPIGTDTTGQGAEGPPCVGA